MAQTEHLPIYKAAYDFCLWCEQVVQGFSRYHKYALGTELRDGARRVLRLIVRANARRDKRHVLLEVREEVEQLKVLLRLGNDVKAFRNFSSASSSHASSTIPSPAASGRARSPRATASWCSSAG